MNTDAGSATQRVAVVGDLFGDPARAAILVALLDGRARTAGELALAGNISAQSASGHLLKLTAGGLLTVRSQGRHRYYELASAEVAHALEAAGSLGARRANGANGANSIAAHIVNPRLSHSDIRMARSCYDHLAGVVAVDLTQRMETSGAIRACGEWEYELGRSGEKFFARLGVDVETLRRGRRAFARRCLDWTERKPHLAGGLGAALFARLLELSWVAKTRDSRVVRVTHLGEQKIGRLGV
ncbi:MAG TPA: helix-turn-helix transcriptional regulator [Bryobacteraceae bacterium]|nr:helix-turn-helix transcriptional regulator [Bryobacteraceae bacterium]